MKNFEVYKKTTDDWHPNYHKNLVRVSYSSFLDQDHYNWDSKYLVCVWGNDDYGMEKWFSGDNGQLAWNIFIKLIEPDRITQKHCYDTGLMPV